MVTMNATTVKNKFGQAMDQAQKEPVLVTKSGRDAVVILSKDEYENLLSVEDAYWSERAKTAEARGYIGTDASEAFMRDQLRAASS